MKAVKTFLSAGAIYLSVTSVSVANEIAIGLATPSPTGITLKLWTTHDSAFDILGAWSINDEKYYIHADYLLHDFSKFRVNESKMPFYYGIGFRIKEEENEDTTLGMRIPFGIAYFMQSAPFEVFGELGPRVDVTPQTNFGLDIMIGIRFRINPMQ